jgi:hypothetical protein
MLKFSLKVKTMNLDTSMHVGTQEYFQHHKKPFFLRIHSLTTLTCNALTVVHISDTIKSSQFLLEQEEAGAMMIARFLALWKTLY